MITSPSEVLQQSFRNPKEVLKKSLSLKSKYFKVLSFSTVVASVTPTQTNIWTSRAAKMNAVIVTEM